MEGLGHDTLGSVNDESHTDQENGYALEPELESHSQLHRGAIQPSRKVSVPEDVVCLRCGYPLRGLDESGDCPECGAAIGRSLHGNLLHFSSPSYVATLHRGVFLIVAGIAGQVVLSLFASVLTATTVIDIGVDSLGIIMNAMILIGWWMFSTPDPAFIGVAQGTTARGVVRTALVVEIAVTIALFATGSLTTAASSLSSTVVVLTVIIVVVSVVRFFAAMMYLRWMAPRIPSVEIDARARQLMWLGPLLLTVGLLLCGLGPLIALVLYWLLLNWVRLALKHVHEIQMAGSFES